MQQKPESAVFTSWLLRNKPFLIYQNSNMALRLGVIKTEEIYYSSLNLDAISFVLFPQALELSLNFNISQMAYSSENK